MRIPPELESIIAAAVNRLARGAEQAGAPSNDMGLMGRIGAAMEPDFLDATPISPDLAGPRTAFEQGGGPLPPYPPNENLDPAQQRVMAAMEAQLRADQQADPMAAAAERWKLPERANPANYPNDLADIMGGPGMDTNFMPESLTPGAIGGDVQPIRPDLPIPEVVGPASMLPTPQAVGSGAGGMGGPDDLFQIDRLGPSDMNFNFREMMDQQQPGGPRGGTGSSARQRGASRFGVDDPIVKAMLLAVLAGGAGGLTDSPA